MLGLFVFVASFLSLFTITLIFQNVPPGYLIVDFFRNTGTNYMIAGISGDILIMAIVNGLSWSVIIILIFFYWRGPEKGKRNLPVWVPGYAKASSSKNDK